MPVLTKLVENPRAGDSLVTWKFDRLAVNLFASLAEFERDVIRERTQAGLAGARAPGRRGGRSPGITSKAEALYREGKEHPLCVPAPPEGEDRSVSTRSRKSAAAGGDLKAYPMPRQSTSAVAPIDLHRRLATLPASSSWAL